MFKKFEIVKCRAVVGGHVNFWIMAADADVEATARQIFADAGPLHSFAELARARVEALDPECGIFTYVTEGMGIEACIEWAVEMGGDEIRLA